MQNQSHRFLCLKNRHIECKTKAIRKLTPPSMFIGWHGLIIPEMTMQKCSIKDGFCRESESIFTMFGHQYEVTTKYKKDS